MDENRFLEAVPEIKALLAERNWPGVALLLGDFHSQEVAESWDEFTLEEKLALLRNCPVQWAVDVFEELETERQVRLIQRLREERATALLDGMAPDERADLFAEFAPELRERFLRLMGDEEAQDVRDLLEYDPDTAGGLMTTDYAWTTVEDTVGESIRRFRENFHEAEAVYNVYVLSKDDRLEGVVTLRQLMLTSDSTPVREVMHTNLVTAPPDIDREDAARICADYDLLAIPIVSAEGRLLGIVTHDDVMDIIEEEAAEDLELFGAVIPGDDDKTYLTTPVLHHCRSRLPWLVLLLFISSISALFFSHFEHVISAQFDPIWFLLLVPFAPMLMGSAGNAATQAATVVIRDLATGDLETSEIGQVFRKEIRVGLLLSGTLAGCGFLRAFLSPATSYAMAAAFGGIVAMSIFITMTFATTAGALLPLLVKRMRLDPAVMSSPLLTSTIDNVTVVLYFSIAIAALQIIA